MARTISLALYTVRVRQVGNTDNLELQQFDAACDLMQDFHLFLADYSQHSSRDEDNQQLLTINRFTNQGRFSKGLVKTGDYGYESDIVNVDNDVTTYRRNTNEAEMLPFYFSSILPRNANEGLICFQRLGQRGIKTAFFNAFTSFFINRHPNYRVQFNEVIPAQVLDRLMNEGVIKKIRLVKFGVPRDIEDLYDEHQREDAGMTEFVISAKRNGVLPLLQRLREVLIGVRQVRNFVEIEGFDYQNAKIEFKIDGKHRTVDLSELDNLSALYDITDDVVMGADGHPTYDSIDLVAQGIMREIYIGMGIGDENVLENQPH